MDYFTQVKRFYELNLYSDDDVLVFVDNGKLTMEQYHQIRGTNNG